MLLRTTLKPIQLGKQQISHHTLHASLFTSDVFVLFSEYLKYLYLGHKRFIKDNYKWKIFTPLNNYNNYSKTRELICQASVESSPSQKLNVVIKNIRKALLVENQNLIKEEVIVKGFGTHLGVRINWKLNIRNDGAFREECTSNQINFTWGSSGAHICDSWEIDNCGIIRNQELDDRESSLLMTWIRSGLWLLPSVLNKLHIEVEQMDFDQDKKLNKGNGNGVIMTSQMSQLERTESSISKNITYKNKYDNDDDELLHHQVILRIKLKKGKVEVLVHVDTRTWHPIAAEQHVCGEKEIWILKDWRQWGILQNISFPSEIIHFAGSGGKHIYQTKEVDIINYKLNYETNIYDQPRIPLIPSDTFFDKTIPSSIKAIKTSSGHILVNPKINGIDAGYMILDTGASGLVIEKNTAELLGLKGFGEIYVSGISGKVPSQFRIGKSLQLGPLTIMNPIFYEMEISGVVNDEITSVTGILGYDIFRRAVVELEGDNAHLSQLDTPNEFNLKNDNKNNNFVVNLYDIEEFSNNEPHGIHWEKLYMITNLPHINVKYAMGKNEKYHKALFMLDTGAGGTSLMFFNRAIEEYKLKVSGSLRSVKGVGGSSSKNCIVTSSNIMWLEMSGYKYMNVDCLFVASSKIDITVYGCGIICMNLLNKCRVILDYANNRGAFIPK